MLKHINKIISPELLKTLDEMGHGDEIVIADGNFPSARIGQRVIRADGHSCTDLLEAILELFPLDVGYSDQQAFLMEVSPGDDYDPVIWKDYDRIIHAENPDAQFGYIDRFAFYERAEKAFAVVASGEESLYANIILKKGVV